MKGRRWRVLGLILVLLVVSNLRPVLAGEEAPGLAEELSTWQEVLNVLKTPFLVIGSLVYYPLKLLFYDLWKALAEWLSCGKETGEEWSKDLGSPDPVRRVRALRILARRGDPSTAPEVHRAIEDGDPSVRRMALLVLRDIDPNGAARRARTLLEDGDSSVRGTAAHVLGETGTRDDAPRLLAVVATRGEEEDPFLLAALLRALVHLDPQSARPLSRRWLLRDRSRDWFLAATAAHSLGELQDRESLQPLREHLEDERYYVRLASAEALARLGDEAWLLTELRVGGENDRVRALLLALGRHGRNVPVESFGVHVGSKDPNIAAAALQALVVQRPRQAIDHAIEWVDSSNPFRRFYGYGLLTKMTGQDHGFDHRAWRDWWRGARSGYQRPVSGQPRDP